MRRIGTRSNRRVRRCGGDNENEIADWEETDVVGEDDLIEMQLSAPSCAPGMWTGWSLSWVDPADVLEVWWYPDKSFGTPLVNGYIYEEWPPWPSVWLEATDATGDDFEITFTIHATTEQRDASLPTRPSDKSDKVRAGNPRCTPAPPEVGRFFIVAKQAGNVTGVDALIDTRSRTPLCDETTVGQGLSGVFAAVLRVTNEGTPAEWKMWANVGYARINPALSPFIKDRVYAETYCGGGPGCHARDIFWDPGLAPVPSGTHRYSTFQPSALLGWWMYNFDSIFFHEFTHPVWIGKTGTKAVWETELLYMEDRMVGDPNNHCRLSELGIGLNWGLRIPASLNPQDIRFNPTWPGASEWGYIWIDATTFEVWDKKP